VEVDIRWRLQQEYSLIPAKNFAVLSQLCTAQEHADVPAVVKTDTRYVALCGMCVCVWLFA
jgi:hypothetical protein